MQIICLPCVEHICKHVAFASFFKAQLFNIYFISRENTNGYGIHVASPLRQESMTLNVGRIFIPRMSSE